VASEHTVVSMQGAYSASPSALVGVVVSIGSSKLRQTSGAGYLQLQVEQSNEGQIGWGNEHRNHSTSGAHQWPTWHAWAVASKAPVANARIIVSGQQLCVVCCVLSVCCVLPVWRWADAQLFWSNA
jgi:hypothetical protein